jgi:hypothetical protein
VGDKATNGPAAAARAMAAPIGVAGQQKQATAADPARDGAAGTAAALGFASMQVAAGSAEPPPSFPMTPAGMLALQRLVGNRAVAAAVERSDWQKSPALQRVAVKYNLGETLYNQEAGDQAGAHHYGGKGTFQVTRDGDAGVGVEVRIKFLKQTRNTMPPRKNHPEDPAVGALTGEQTELPQGDRDWATKTASDSVTLWNGKLVLVGKDKPRPDAEEVNKRLPVTFKASPVFGKGDASDTTVIVHPPGVMGGSKGNPIDAGNYYMKKDDSVYPESDAMIYAHEYGHLIGINDEYSQSNEQMNMLIHRAAPGEAASSMAALDKKTLELMALAELSRPLYAQLTASMGAVKNAIAGQKKAVKRKMAEAAKSAAKSPEIGQLLTDRLTNMSIEKVKKHVPRAVAVQTTSNFAATNIATTGVDRILAPGGVSKLIGDAYWQALVKPQGENVNIPGLGDVKIDVAESIWSAPDAKGAKALNKAAAGEAKGVVGRPGLPKLPPPETLIGQLTGAAGTWNAAGGAVETGINAGTFTAKMKATLEAATAAAAAPPILLALLGVPGPAPSIKSSQKLYEKAWVLMFNAANAAVKQLTSELVTSTMNPVLQASATALQAAISAEVQRVMTMTPAELAANPSPDPNMAAIVGDVKGRLDASKAALKGTGMDPLGVAGGTTPAQDVTYSYQGMMGSGKTTEMRTDQFAQIVDSFNTKLKFATEQNFSAETK